MDTVLWAFVVSVGINIVLFVPAFRFKTDNLTDVSYAITFIAVTVFAYLRSARTSLQLVILLLILLWAVRLGGFLLGRIQKVGKDRRFDNIRDRFIPFLRFWVLQGITVFVILLAALLGFTQKHTSLGIVNWIGAAIFAFGLSIEAIADAQKFRFKRKPKNKSRWIDEGLWRLSHHLNYLGEIMVWLGICVLVAPSLALHQMLIAVLSPLYIIVLLLFVSGIPPLEKSAQQKWSDQTAYQRYKSEVPLLIPTLKSIKRLSPSATV